MARFRGKPFQPAGQELLFDRARSHGLGLARRFKGMWAEGLILEVGSSTGGVLAELRDELALPVIGIEPSQPEADEANRRGIQTYCALMENFRAEIDPPPIPKASTICSISACSWPGPTPPVSCFAAHRAYSIHTFGLLVGNPRFYFYIL